MSVVTMDQLREIAATSEFHARAATMLSTMQIGFERQRRIWQLREDVKALQTKLADAQAALGVEESEQERERKLVDEMLAQLERTPAPGES